MKTGIRLFIDLIITLTYKMNGYNGKIDQRVFSLFSQTVPFGVGY